MNTISRPGSPADAREGELLGELPSASGDERVEVWRRVGTDGESQIEMLQFHWGSGVGWYVQKSMTLDAAQAALLGSLMSAVSAPSSSPTLTRSAGPRPRPHARQDGNLVQLLFS